MSAGVDPVGVRFPAGRYEIEPWEDQILRQLLEAPPRSGDLAHPLWGYVAAQNGIGTDVKGLLEPVQASTSEGTMIASCEVDYHHDLRVGVPYSTKGRVLGLERKRGRKLGPFDLYTFEIELVEPEGATAVTMTARWVLPRREAEDA